MKKIILILIFLVSSPYLSAASYELFNESNNLSGSGIVSPLNRNLDDFFYNPDFFSNKLSLSQAKQDYFDILDFIKKRQLNNADNKINTLIKKYPNEPDFYNLKALLEIIRKNSNLAIQSYKKAIRLDQTNLKSHLGLADLYLKSGNISKAKEYASKSLFLNDKSILVYFLLSDIANKENNKNAVENSLLTAQKISLGNIKKELAVANALAKHYAVTKQPEKTLLLAENIISRYPGNSLALSFLSSSQLQNSKNQQAIQTLKKLIHQEKQDIRHRLILANLLGNQEGNEKKVNKLLDEVSIIAPDNPQILVQVTAYQIKLGYFSAALDSVKKVKRLFPNTGLSELLSGDLNFAEKKQDQALSSYKKSYKIKPNIKVFNQIVNLMVSQDKKSEAINFLKEELQKNPKNLNAHFKLANIYKKENNIKRTEKHYNAILKEQPDNALVLNNLAWFYYKNNSPKALAHAQKAYQAAPESPAVADTYGSILVKEGNLDKAINILEKASKQAPEVYDIQYHLANAYALNGDRKLAIEILNRIVDTEKNFSGQKDAVRLLRKIK